MSEAPLKIATEIKLLNNLITGVSTSPSDWSAILAELKMSASVAK